MKKEQSTIQTKGRFMVNIFKIKKQRKCSYNILINRACAGDRWKENLEEDSW